MMNLFKSAIIKIVKRGQVQALPGNQGQPQEDGSALFKNGGIDPEKTGTRYGAGFIDNGSAEKRLGTAGGGQGEGD